MIGIWSILQADATATPSSLAPVKSRMVYLSVASYPGCPGKKAVKGCSSVVVFYTHLWIEMIR